MIATLEGGAATLKSNSNAEETPGPESTAPGTAPTEENVVQQSDATAVEERHRQGGE